jgi:hypothetical protein
MGGLYFAHLAEDILHCILCICDVYTVFSVAQVFSARRRLVGAQQSRIL